MSDKRTPRCFYCDADVSEKEARLTKRGKVFGTCCADLGEKEAIGC